MNNDTLGGISPFINAKVVASGVDPRVYHAEQKVPRGHPERVMTRGELMTFNRNPQAWILGVEDPSTKATEFGQVAETIALSPETFFERIAIQPETYTNKKGQPSKWKNDRRIEEVAAWLDEHEGFLCIKGETNGVAHAAVKRLQEDAKISALLACSETQVVVTGEYQDKGTGLVVPVKCMIDILPKAGSPFQKCIADMKTARNASPGAWSRVVFDDGLHVQAAFYSDLYVAATGEDRTDWLHVIVENVQPYEPARRILELAFVELGRDQYQLALKRYCRCLAARHWPGYDADGGAYGGWTMTNLEPWMVARANGQVLDLPEPEPETEPDEKPADDNDEIIP